MSRLGGGGANLQYASRIRGNNHVGRSFGDVVSFAPAELCGQLRLSQVEDPGASAANLTLFEWHDGDAWYRGQKRARFAANALRMGQVTGIVVSNRQFQLPPRRTWRVARGENLRHIAHFGRKRLRPLGPGRIVAQEVTVFLHR